MLKSIFCKEYYIKVPLDGYFKKKKNENKKLKKKINRKKKLRRKSPFLKC